MAAHLHYFRFMMTPAYLNSQFPILNSQFGP